MQLSPYKIVLAILLTSCTNATTNATLTDTSFTPSKPQNILYARVAQIPLPTGYTRMAADTNSFAQWLRRVPLKTSNAVYLFNGTAKQNQTAQFAVLDVSIGKKNLQQCADAVMRLRAEYLFSQGQYHKVSFTDNAGTVYHFKQPFTRQNFDVYLERVFGMCGTASLAKQLMPETIQAILPGDVLIRGGFPGHAVMVMDVAVNAAGGKIYLLAQSYMPAQDIHILKNPANGDFSPWYRVSDDELIETPEYTFTKNEFKKW